jgi:hypothetical protein
MSWATADDYTAWSGSASPGGIEATLRRAENVIKPYLITAVYDTDDEGQPTDTAILAALRDATCAQASEIVKGDASGEMSAAGFSSVGIGSLSLGLKDSSTSFAFSGAITGEVRAILSAAGLLSGVVATY